MGSVGEFELVPVGASRLVVQAKLRLPAHGGFQEIIVVRLPTALLHLLDLLLNFVLFVMLPLSKLCAVLLVPLVRFLVRGVIAIMHLQLHLEEPQDHGTHLVEEITVVRHDDQRHIAQLF